MKLLRRSFFLMVGGLLAATLLTQAPAAQAMQVVRVGATHFPPYVVRPEKGDDQGLLPVLLARLNSSQQHYRFVMVPTSLTRRFRDFADGRVDIALFENPAWGWQDIAHTAVDMGLEDREVFVARNVPGRQQDYFDDLSGKHLALVNGYHYGFAGFNAAPAYLNTHFHATLTYSHESNLLMLSRGRVDITPVTRSFLHDASVRQIVQSGQLLVSERVDQIYRHYALVRPEGIISAGQFDRLLQQLRDNGQMASIFEPYRITITHASAPVTHAVMAAAQ